MPKALLLVFLILLCKPALAQNHFIYFQAENRQAFQITLANKTFKSSKSGYILLTPVSQGEHEINIQFPSGEWPAQSFRLNVVDDAGYTLKNFGEKGWGLFNLQKLDIVMNLQNNSVLVASSTEQSKPNPSISSMEGNKQEPEINSSEPIQYIDSIVVNQQKEIAGSSTKPLVDSSVAYNTTEKNDATAHPQNINNANVFDTSHTVLQDSNKIPPSPPQHLDVERLAVFSDLDGVSLVYQITTDKGFDTVKIFLPGQELATVKVVAIEPIVANVQDSITSKDSSFLKPSNISTSQTEQTKPVVVQKNEMELEPALEYVEDSLVQKVSSTTPHIQENVTLPAGCKKLATENECVKLRKKMAGETTTVAILSLTEKAFKSSCFTTEQVKNLAIFFIDDLDKLNFYKQAYPAIVDKGNFPTLANTLRNPASFSIITNH